MERKKMTTPENHVSVEVRGCAGLITLNRPKALNALSLQMVRDISAALLSWRDNHAIELVAIRGMGKNPAHTADPSQPAFTPFGSFCAGGDIRYFHQAALAGDPSLEDFFTEEYALNHLIHTYPKPYVAFMDGIVMGGGMGIAQGASHRIATERTKMAMPETGIGLFPDVGGGYFLSRCPGGLGEYLGLTGQLIGAQDAVHAGLADVVTAADGLAAAWDALTQLGGTAGDQLHNAITGLFVANNDHLTLTLPKNSQKIDTIFCLESVQSILQALDADGSDWGLETAATLRKRSPLMLCVVLEQIRRARSMSLADDLRMERDIVRHCFHTAHLGRSGVASETVEGIRALAVDKDHAPKWNPAALRDVTVAMVQPFFASPWPAAAHPLRMLQ
jgi:enoyl-CoA hydratase/carnithine racemase